MQVKDLLKYENVTDKSLFTIMSFDKSKNDFLDNLKKYQKKCGLIKNSFLKNIICNRLYEFIEFLQTEFNQDKINHIFLVGKETVIYSLKKKEIGTLREYNIKNYLFYYDTYYKVEYLVDLLTNFKFTNSIVLSKGKVSYTKMNENKKKSMAKKKCKNIKDFEEFLKNNDISEGIITGKNNILNKFIKKGFIIYNKNLKNDEILKKIKENKMIEKHKELEDLFLTFNDESKLHLLLFGNINKDIKEAIECYQVKQLYCHKDKIKELKSQCSKECYNFEIIEIDKVDNNDVSHKLLNDYGGVVGVKYY